MSLHAKIYDKYLSYQMLVLTNRGQEAVEEHETMFQAALKRVSDTAKATLETHIMRGLEHTLAGM